MSPKRADKLCGPPCFLYPIQWIAEDRSLEWRGWGVDLIAHLKLAPRLRMSIVLSPRHNRTSWHAKGKVYFLPQLWNHMNTNRKNGIERQFYQWNYACLTSMLPSSCYLLRVEHLALRTQKNRPKCIFLHDFHFCRQDAETKNIENWTAAVNAQT